MYQYVQCPIYMIVLNRLEFRHIFSSWHHLDPKYTLISFKKSLEIHNTIKCAQTASTIWKVLQYGGTPDHPSHYIMLVYFETQVDFGIPHEEISICFVISESIFLVLTCDTSGRI